MKKVLVFLLALSISQASMAQKDAATMLNNYVHFANESIHGLLIVHRLLENSNQDINKYVDLDGYQINFYTNKDLPRNIFEDPDDFFYKSKSPTKWITVLQEEHSSGLLPESESLFASAKKMNNICKAINNIRFEVEEYIDSHDLNDKKQLQGVYDLLENGVKYYDDFHSTLLTLEQKVKSRYASLGINRSDNLYSHMLTFHKNVKKIMRALRAKQDKDIPTLLAEMKEVQPKIIQDLSTRLKEQRIQKIEEKLNACIESSEAYFLTASVPKEYKLYKKFYYYHNSDIVNKMNRYGNGYVTLMNEVFQNSNPKSLLLFEEPHFYQVIYPEKLKTTDYIESSDDNVTVIPDMLKEREIISGKHKITIDSERFQIFLYDHMIKDGDEVSINYNGDWIFEDYSLEAKPLELKLKLNKEGKNYLILHAASVGRRPPNTMAISYKFNEEKKNIVMRSDLNASELIEIVYEPK